MLLSSEARGTLEHWQRSTTIAAGLARRGKMILRLAAGHSQSAVAGSVGVHRTVVRKWAKRCLAQRLDGLSDAPGRGAKGGVPPEVAIHGVRLACERPDPLGRSLSQGDCTELARQLIATGIVEDLSAATVRRMLAAHQLKPWRQHVWLSPQQPRDAAFYATVSDRIALYTRPLREAELVLSVDEKTSLQPRPRRAPTLPAQPQNMPNRHEHESKRAGARNLLAAFDTRSGKVYGHCSDRKRQRECMAFLAAVELEIHACVRTIHRVCDYVSPHHGQEVQKWLANHPRFVMHFTPGIVGMNQVEQWFSILHRKRLRIVDFESKDHLDAKLRQFLHEWNHHAHPFNWSTKSVATVMAAAPALAA